MTDLKHAIQAKYKIAVQHQILVVNGGECMAPDRRVCSYSAGTVSIAVSSHFAYYCVMLLTSGSLMRLCHEDSHGP